MAYYFSVINQAGEATDQHEFSTFDEALQKLCSQYLKEPETLFSMNADCRLNSRGQITRVFVSSECHNLKQGYEDIKFIQISTDKDVANKDSGRTLGEDFKPSLRSVDHVVPFPRVKTVQ